MEAVVQYPNLATAKMAELVAFYNEHSGLEPVKSFKRKDDAVQAVQQVIAKLEGTEPEGLEEEAEELHTEALSMSAQLLSANSGVQKTSEKNEGVGRNVMMLLEQGLSNKEILAKIHEMYGNANTSYACVAWYRNKWKKTGGASKMISEAKMQQLTDFAKKHGLSVEAVDELVALL